MYLLIASADKISLNSFLRYTMNSLRGKPIESNVGLFNSFMTEEQIEEVLKELTKKSPEGILTYFAKGLVNKDPMIYLPKRLIETVDTIVWFELYSTEPKVLKSSSQSSEFSSVIQGWNSYIQKISD